MISGRIFIGDILMPPTTAVSYWTLETQGHFWGGLAPETRLGRGRFGSSTLCFGIPQINTVQGSGGLGGRPLMGVTLNFWGVRRGCAP